MLVRRGEVGRRVRIARRERGLSVRQLARAIGRSFHTVYRWEQGRVDPGLADVRALSGLLERPMSWFAFGDNECAVAASSGGAAA